MLSFLAQGIFGWAQTKTYDIDVQKSLIEFNVDHMGVLNVKGSFESFQGTLVFKDNKLLKIHSTIDAKSIVTKDESRDKTLRSKPYLNVNEYPKIHFSSSAVEDTNARKTITGTLRIRDVEKTISFPFEYGIKEDGIYSIIAETKIDRREFGLDFGSMNALIGNQVSVTLIIGYSAN